MKTVDKPWMVEQRGISQVPVAERYGQSRDLFYIWFAANIGFLGLLYGTMILMYHLPFWEGVVVTILGSFSFLLVGILGIDGKNTGLPMLMVARNPFGSIGNVLPSLISWVNLLGWETIIWITATQATTSLIDTVYRKPLHTLGTTTVFLLLGVLTFLVALYGHATIVKIQKWITVIFGTSTLAVLIELLLHHQVYIAHYDTPASFTEGFLPAVAAIVLGAGLSWVTTASDYTRYMPPTTSSSGIVIVTFLGGAIPLIGMIVAGMLLTPTLPGLATSPNPLGELGEGLSPFWRIVFWLSAAVGLLTENILAIYSSGLTLQTMHIRIARPRTAIVEFLITGLAGLAFLRSDSSFMVTFQSFLTLIGGTLAPWAGVMVADLVLRKKVAQGLPAHLAKASHFSVGERWSRFRIRGLLAYALGVVATLLFASSTIWHGPLAATALGQSQFGFVVGFLVALISYGLSAWSYRAAE